MVGLGVLKTAKKSLSKTVNIYKLERNTNERTRNYLFLRKTRWHSRRKMSKKFYGMYYGKDIFDYDKALAAATARLLLLTANDPFEKYTPDEETKKIKDAARKLMRFALSN